MVRAQAQTQQPWHMGVAGKIMACGLASTLALGAMSAPVQAADMKVLGDVVRADFAFVDGNKDGYITKEEMVSVAKQVAEVRGIQNACGNAWLSPMLMQYRQAATC